MEIAERKNCRHYAALDEVFEALIKALLGFISSSFALAFPLPIKKVALLDKKMKFPPSKWEFRN